MAAKSIPFRVAFERKRYPIVFDQPSLTKQSFKDECDVNFILAKYERTGLVDHISRFQGDYSDVTDTVDLHTALNIVRDANDAFASLPSNIRKRFNNDPAHFMDFVSDPENRDEMISLGLISDPGQPVRSGPSIAADDQVTTTTPPPERSSSVSES